MNNFLNDNLECGSSSGDPKLNDVHFVNLSLVSELQVKKEVTNVPEVPQSLNLQRLNTRVRNQVGEKKANVTSNICELPPYQLENIRGNTTSKEYGYIRKVVEKHMKDIALNSQNPSVCQNNSPTQ
ncbi:hypothetical protein NQ314_007307 [Rhamnusium bicolor]|uniref:Uncharacterized protein n=1 Tax=Rhamnusium bicolor TaxID=1586634 RepID=A0AAV8YQS2_9CUCU|nr:hypothetical protein NQ314_007307 [Rhamnusium bicolor]